MNELVLRTACALAKRANADLAVSEPATKFNPDGGLLPTSGIDNQVDEIAREFSGNVQFWRLPFLAQAHSGERNSAKNDAEIAATVLACADRNGVSKVVVSAHSVADPLGGLTGQLVTHSDIPVVVVPANSVELCEDPVHLVVAIDETPNVGLIPTRISEIYVWFDIRLSLLHVLYQVGKRINGVSVLAHDRAAHQMKRCASRLDGFGVDDTRTHTFVHTGSTPEVIVDQITREHATLGILPVTCSLGHHRRPNGVSNDVLIDRPVPILLFCTAGAIERDHHLSQLPAIEAVGR